jgi:hypothetical protein
VMRPQPLLEQRRQALQLDCSRFAPPGGQLALL